MLGAEDTMESETGISPTFLELISVITSLLLVSHMAFIRLFNPYESKWPIGGSVFSSINGDHYSTYSEKTLQISNKAMCAALSADT